MFSSGQEFGVKSTLYTCWRLSYISLYPLSIHLSCPVSPGRDATTARAAQLTAIASCVAAGDQDHVPAMSAPRAFALTP